MSYECLTITCNTKAEAGVAQALFDTARDITDKRKLDCEYGLIKLLYHELYAYSNVLDIMSRSDLKDAVFEKELYARRYNLVTTLLNHELDGTWSIWIQCFD